MTNPLSSKRRRAQIFTILAGFGIALSALPAHAGSLVYQPVNPHLGGSPLNGNWLQNQAQVQNEFTRREQRQQQIASALEQAKKTATGSSAELTQGQIFARQLQSQLYSSLANQITRAIFGENAKESGSFAFEGTRIDFRRVNGNVEVTINDGSSITSVVVPAGL